MEAAANFNDSSLAHCCAQNTFGIIKVCCIMIFSLAAGLAAYLPAGPAGR